VNNSKPITKVQQTEQGISVLLVDDEAHGLAALMDVIQNMDNAMLCSGAKSVREAIAIAEKNHVDILISDYHLGDGTGLDISTQLNLMLKTIIISADVAVKKIAEKMNIPFLMKPIVTTELETMIKEFSSKANKEDK